MTEAWLRCSVSKGMFSDELAVTIPGTWGEHEITSVFVPRDLVRHPSPPPTEGHVKVRSYFKDSTWWAILPTEYDLAIPVKSSDLVPA